MCLKLLPNQTKLFLKNAHIISTTLFCKLRSANLLSISATLFSNCKKVKHDDLQKTRVFKHSISCSFPYLSELNIDSKIYKNILICLFKNMCQSLFKNMCQSSKISKSHYHLPKEINYPSFIRLFKLSKLNYLLKSNYLHCK